MAMIKPFAALRPRPELAARICELPYDVMSSAEARVMAGGNELSFLHVSKPEIDLAESVDPYDRAVYAKGRENFQKLRQAGALCQDPAPAFYLYRQVMGAHAQTGLVGVASCQDYLAGVIKKHEFTRPDKEDDRVRHIETLDAQTGPVFLTYRADAELSRLLAKWAAGAPDIDFAATDGVRHSAWPIRDPETIMKIEQAFARIGNLYIADGHHRSAAAARVFQTRSGAGGSASFLSVIFPHDQLQILPYNRVLEDFNNHALPKLMSKLDSIFTMEPHGKPAPARKHQLGFFVHGNWWSLEFRPELTAAGSATDRLDVTLLQKHVLGPIFGIDDPRTSRRIRFVGGIRGTPELEKLVTSGGQACAFSMFPTGIEDLMSIADAGGIMPPKSTWFEPKLRDGMFSHLL